MNFFARVIIGALGGLAAAASKVLALDVHQLALFLDQGNLNGIDSLRVTLFIFTPILMGLGALVAWASDEDNRIKLLAIGCAAPAIIAPWTPTGTSIRTTDATQAITIVSPAFAESATRAGQGPSYFSGIEVLLGLRSPKDERYWVIVGSKKDQKSATAIADSINKEAPDLRAFVGKREPGNSYYPILLGGKNGYLPLEQAKALRKKANDLNLIPNDSYLSSYRDRWPNSSAQ